MSMRQVLDTVDALLKDDALGLTATTIAFAAQHPEIVGNPGPLGADFNFVKWALPGQAIRPTQYAGNVMLAPVSWNGNTRDPGTTRRDARAVVEIGFECFAGSTDDLQSQLVLVFTALLQVLDRLVDWSVTKINGVPRGPIYEVDSVTAQWAQYASATSGGWLATVTLLERSSDD